MSTPLTSKYVLITGASSGIGRACARHLDANGYHIFAGVRTDADASLLRKESSKRLTPILLDVGQKETICEAAKFIAAKTEVQGLGGLINNAGILLAGPLEYVDLDQFRALMEINVFGVIAMNQSFISLLRRGKGRIINIGSISGRVALPFLGPYAASKFALEALSDSLRLELRPWGIGVSLIIPGNVESLIREKAVSGLRRDMQALPPLAHSFYGPVLQAATEHQNRKCMSADVIAKAVERALSDRKPKAKYLLGMDARILSLIHKLPTGLRDSIIASKLPKYGTVESADQKTPSRQNL